LDTQLTEDQDRDGTAIWDPTAPPRLALVADPGGTDGVSFGSFLVFRKLEQNVKGFKLAQRRLADELKLPLKLIGAMAVGRFEDGTPVVLQPGENAEPAAPNDFDYSSDASGRRCPFHAHIRKSHPRLESVLAGGGFAEDDEEERGHRIARRGIPYGGGLSDFTDPDALPERGVGLLFMCYQSDLWEQFEFMQRFWCNNDKFLRPGLRGSSQDAPDYVTNTGMDSIVGQQQQILDPITGFTAPPTTWPSEWGQQAEATRASIARFVTMRGGEYFFSPSLTFLRNLAPRKEAPLALLMPPEPAPRTQPIVKRPAY
jgi:Dyp-type peroxidase family